MITTTPADFLTTVEVKAHLNKTTTVDDTELLGFIAAAQNMIVDRIGQVSPVTVVEDRSGWRRRILLEQRPIVSITSVQELPGLAMIPEADEAAGVDGWRLDSTEGVLVHTSRLFPCRVRVTYKAGRDPVPGNVRKAGHFLAAHLWQSSQLASGGNRPVFGSEAADEPYMPGMTHALPFRVRELLGLGKHMTDRPLVG